MGAGARALLGVVALALAACDQGAGAQPNTEIPELKARLDKLESGASALESKVFVTELRLDTLDGKYGGGVEAGEEGYSVIRTQFGAFLVDYQKSEPFGAGFQVVLRIANLTSATFDGLKLHVEYGPTLVKNKEGKSTPDQYKTYYDAKRNKDFTLTDRLIAGRWNYIKLAFTPAKAEDVGELSVKLDLDRLTLLEAPHQ